MKIINCRNFNTAIVLIKLFYMIGNYKETSGVVMLSFLLSGIFLSIIRVTGIAPGRVVRRVARPERQVVPQQLHDERRVLHENTVV